MSIWFRRAPFQCAGQGREQICGFVEESFGALGDERRWGGGGVVKEVGE